MAEGSTEGVSAPFMEVIRSSVTQGAIGDSHTRRGKAGGMR